MLDQLDLERGLADRLDWYEQGQFEMARRHMIVRLEVISETPAIFNFVSLRFVSAGYLTR